MAIARFLVDGAVSSRIGGDFPAATLAVNLSGTLVLGVLAGAALSGLGLHDPRGRRDRHLHDVLDLDARVASGRGGRRRPGALGEHRGVAARRARRGRARSLDRGTAVSAAGGELRELRFYFGERDRAGDRPLDVAVMEACERAGVRAAVLLRGIAGFGAGARVRSDRLLTLSEDAPLVVVAVGDARDVEGLAR